MNEIETKLYTWSTICFIISTIIMIPIVFQFTPEGRFPPGTQIHQIFTWVWWICGLSTLIFLFIKKMAGNFSGTVLVVVMGPVVTLTIGLFYALKKFKVIKL
jgi:hypothetical protein